MCDRWGVPLALQTHREPRKFHVLSSSIIDIKKWNISVTAKTRQPSVLKYFEEFPMQLSGLINSAIITLPYPTYSITLLHAGQIKTTVDYSRYIHA